MIGDVEDLVKDLIYVGVVGSRAVLTGVGDGTIDRTTTSPSATARPGGVSGAAGGTIDGTTPAPGSYLNDTI